MTTLEKVKATASGGLERLEDLAESAVARSRWSRTKSFTSSNAGKIAFWSVAGALAAALAVAAYRRWSEASAYMDDDFEAEAEAAGSSRLPEDSGLAT